MFRFSCAVLFIFGALAFASPDSHWERVLENRYASKQACHVSLADAFGPSLGTYDAVKWDGWFHPAAAEKLEFIRNLYAVTGGDTFSFDPKKIRRATRKDIGVWAWSDDTAEGRNWRLQLHKQALTTWSSTAFSFQSLSVVPARLTALGFDGFSSLYYLTSGAGNWRRGAKLVKALVPLNLRECLGDSEWHELGELANFAVADMSQRQILRAVAEQQRMRYAHHLQSLDAGEMEIRRIVTVARNNPNSINPLEAKLAQVAVLSALTRRYIHFDVWTSRSTHLDIRKALINFANNYRTKNFFTEPFLNEFVHQSIANYLSADTLLGETHLFGYQEEVWPLSPNPMNPQYLMDEDSNGEGAGMAYGALQATGRLAQLKHRQVKHWMFQNIEVLSMDLLAQYGAFLKLNLPIGVVQVPEKNGSTGGFPYMITDEFGNEWPILLEGVGVPKELKKFVPGSYFNSNTFFNELDLRPVVGMDYESKLGRHGSQIALPKLSLGFSTHTNRTGFIGGELGWDYQDFKKLSDYERDGAPILELFRRALADDIGFMNADVGKLPSRASAP
jgi:hypothetical protein